MCPVCGEYAYRSRTHGVREKLIRALSHYCAFRCHACGWRGWASRGGRVWRRFVGPALLRGAVGALVAAALILAVLYVSG